MGWYSVPEKGEAARMARVACRFGHASRRAADEAELVREEVWGAA